MQLYFSLASEIKSLLSNYFARFLINPSHIDGRRSVANAVSKPVLTNLNLIQIIISDLF